MPLFIVNSEKKRNKLCILCDEKLTDTIASPNICNHSFHYKCIRNYTDNCLEKKEPVICPEKCCNKLFGCISNTYKNSEEIVYQNVILSNDETQCCICFSKYSIPVASSDSCLHSFCVECLKKWCTFKHECPMDRVPIKMLLISDFPGSHITSKMEPPAIEQDLTGDGDNDELINTTCEVCNSGQDEHQLLLCDNCNRGYHIYCLPVPLNNIPDGDWFCEECLNHSVHSQEDEIPVEGQLLLRGLGRVLTHLQNRFASSQIEERPTRRRNRRVETSARPIRSTRRNGFVGESDDDWREDIVSDEETYPNLRPTRNRNSADRLSGGNPAVEEEDQEAQIDEIVTRPRRQEPSSVSNYASDNTTSSRTRRGVVAESEDESPVINTRRNNRTRPTRTSNTRIALRRRRLQGSLSSDIESEAESTRKRRRVDSGSTSNDARTVTEDEIDVKSTSEDTSTDEEIRNETSPITTRLRARENQTSGLSDESSTLPRHTNKTRKIMDEDEEILNETGPITTRLRARENQTSGFSNESLSLPRRITKTRKILVEDSEDEQNTDEEHELDTHVTNNKKRLIVESSDDEMTEERTRHMSTSSSLSTIPCRITDLNTLFQLPNQSNSESINQTDDTPEDELSDSSTCESNGSENTDWTPSTSLDQRSTKKRLKRATRSSSRIKKITTKKSESEMSRSSNEKITHSGRENHSRSQRMNTRSFNSSGSILSELNDSQNNLRNVGSLCPTATVRKEKIILSIKQIQSNNNSKNGTHAHTNHIDQPSTSQQSSVASCSTNNSNNNRDNHCATKTKRFVTSALNNYYNTSDIDKEELSTIRNRIMEKINRKNSGDAPLQEKVEEFVKKYMKFYLNRKI